MPDTIAFRRCKCCKKDWNDCNCRFECNCQKEPYHCEIHHKRLATVTGTVSGLLKAVTKIKREGK